MWRVWTGLVFAAWVGIAPAQSQPARPAAPQPAGDILVQKTAGQPDRRLRLLRIDTGPDGQRVADVQDLTSGAKYTLPAAALSGMKREVVVVANPTPPSPPAAKQPVAIHGKFPTSLPLPEPTAGSHSPFVNRPLHPTPEPRPRPQTGWAEPQRPVAPTQPVALGTPLTTLVATPTTPQPVTPQVEPAPPLTRTTRSAALPPFALADSTPAPASEPPVSLPTPAAVRLTVPDPAPPQLVQHTTLSLAPWQLSRAEQMRAEIEPYTSDLVNALRPSVRERAATTLANCRHASSPEVKQLLARTAITDPSPTVQAHCVSILTALGYHERDYVEFLELSLGSDTPRLRQAAAAALAKLAPR